MKEKWCSQKEVYAIVTTRVAVLKNYLCPRDCKTVMEVNMEMGRLSSYFIFFVLGCSCVEFYPSVLEGHAPRSVYRDNRIPGVSGDSSSSCWGSNQGNGQEKIAQANVETPYPEDAPVRMGNWDYKENWRYDRDAFYRGESQSQAYKEEHPYGPEGIGYDADLNYQRNLRRYRQLRRQHSSRNIPPNQFQDPSNYLNQDGTIYYDPYHIRPYQGNYGEGSYHHYRE
jgi:hypothetical protein